MRRPHPFDLILVIIGLAMLVGSGVMAEWTADWTQAALLTVGAAVLLGVVLRWVASAIRDATQEAQAAATTATHEAAEAREHAETAATLRDRMRADITDLDERLRGLLDPDGRPVVITARAAATG